MTERAFTTKASKNIPSRKCCERSQRRDPEASKYLGQLGLIQNFDRLVTKKTESFVTSNDKFRSGCKGRDKRTITDADTTRSLEQAKTGISLVPKGKRRSDQHRFHRGAYRRSKSDLSAKTASRATSCTSSPSRSAKGNLYTEAFKCTNNGIKSPNLIRHVTSEYDEAITA
jgi:hypothetical protein